MDNILNIVSNEHLPLHPFKQKNYSANNSLIHDNAISKKKKKNPLAIHSIPTSTITNKTSLVNISNTIINSEGILYQ